MANWTEKQMDENYCLKFGKNKNIPLKELNSEYLRWLLENALQPIGEYAASNAKIRNVVEKILNDRHRIQPPASAVPVNVPIAQGEITKEMLYAAQIEAIILLKEIRAELLFKNREDNQI